MYDIMMSLTFKPLAFLSSTAYLMFANVPLNIPIPVDKGIALTIAVWALIATKRELEKTRKDFREELKEERGRSDAHLESLNKLADGLTEISRSVDKCPLKNHDKKP